MVNPYQFWNAQLEKDYEAFMHPPQTPRKTSATSLSSSAIRPSLDTSRIHTRSDGCPFSPGIIFECSPSTSPQTDDDLIFVVVRISNRAGSETPPNELPVRPAKRTFLGRLGTRLLGRNDANDFKAIRMPRSAYKQYFARDGKRNYVGTEPEREWSEEDLRREFRRYQETPLREMHC